nr:MAG TPA: hypothetical protein [Caudoviricetes sp.]
MLPYCLNFIAPFDFSYNKKRGGDIIKVYSEFW